MFSFFHSNVREWCFFNTSDLILCSCFTPKVFIFQQRLPVLCLCNREKQTDLKRVWSSSRRTLLFWRSPQLRKLSGQISAWSSAPHSELLSSFRNTSEQEEEPQSTWMENRSIWMYLIKVSDIFTTMCDNSLYTFTVWYLSKLHVNLIRVPYTKVIRWCNTCKKEKSWKASHLHMYPARTTQLHKIYTIIHDKLLTVRINCVILLKTKL